MQDLELLYGDESFKYCVTLKNSSVLGECNITAWLPTTSNILI